MAKDREEFEKITLASILEKRGGVFEYTSNETRCRWRLDGTGFPIHETLYRSGEWVDDSPDDRDFDAIIQAAFEDARASYRVESEELRSFVEKIAAIEDCSCGYQCDYCWRCQARIALQKLEAPPPDGSDAEDVRGVVS